MQALYPSLEIILVVDSPYAGHFVQANVGDLSDRRVVIAGTSHSDPGILNPVAATISFSRYFLGNAYQGKDLWTSYDGAFSLVVDHIGQAEPKLDDNGDGETTKNDKKLAKTWYLGRRGVLAGSSAVDTIPAISDASTYDFLVNQDFDCWVDLLQAIPPQRVWVTLVSRGNAAANRIDYPEIELRRIEETWRWRATVPHSIFSHSGDYTLVFNASFFGEQVSEPLMRRVSIQGTGNSVEQWMVH